jgi:hypothetical protein
VTTAHKILNLVFGLTVALFLLDILTDFDIGSQALKSVIYFGTLIGTPLTLVWNFFAFKQKGKRVLGTLFPIAILILILVVGPVNIIFSSSAWRTQTILYQHGHFSFKTIEFQMQDIGALGYNDRTVEVFHLTPFFMIANDIPKDIDQKVEWTKVDKEVNELHIKYP